MGEAAGGPGPRLYRPRQNKIGALRIVGELPKALLIGPGRLGDLLRALAELAFARILLARKTVQALGIPDLARTHAPPASPQLHEATARVSKAIAIVAPRVPWRSDCLVQCLAGRRWLAAKGVPARITIGVKREKNEAGAESLLAHAWLTVGDIMITGGDIGEFRAFGDPGGVARP